MKAKELEKEILLSHSKCSRQGLPKNLTQPKNKLTRKKLDQIIEHKKELMNSFTESVDEIKDFITEDFLFLLTNSDAILLKKKSTLNNNISIKPGISFRVSSSGTNAISLAKRIKDKVFLTPEHHYCNFFRQWYCFTVPINYQGEIIGFLDVSSVKKELKDELKGITVLLKDRILKKLRKFKLRKESVELTVKQQEVLEHLSCGLTEKEIANKLHCSKNTIKYHKKILFKELNIDNTRKAIIKAIKLGIIDPQEIEI